MQFLWLALMVVFLFVEAGTVALVSAWFAAGALAALIAALLGAEIWLQITVFLAVSAALLACLRPLVRKYFKPKIVRTNVDSLIGSEGYVTADIDNVAAVGQVKLGAMEWTARSSSGENIPKGTLVKVERIEGVKAFVTPVKVTAEA
ncbi:MAG: NfeD family protein [Oscillospiraceae bacterium]|nr:NfeD family protein [Oscillospiraceae bacterium]